MDRKELRDALAAEWATSAEHKRLLTERAKAEVEAQIVSVDEQWAETERKHRSAMKSSTSEAWSRSLLMVCEERRAKHEAVCAAFRHRVAELAVPLETPRLDLGALDFHLDAVHSQISKYSPTLAVKRRQLEHSGEYGNVENEKWLAEIAKLIAKNPQIANSIRALQSICDTAEIQFDWTVWVTRRIDATVDPVTQLPEPTRSDGVGFEHACLAALVRAGWQGGVTKATGDQGVDIIARKGNLSIAVQCKNHNVPVGNGAVQEVHAGMAFHEAGVAVVVSPSGFTESAIQLARKLGVRLVDPSSLGKLEEFL